MSSLGGEGQPCQRADVRGIGFRGRSTLPVGVLRVMGRTDDALTEVANYGPSETLASPILPGLTASLSIVFRRPSFTA